MEHQSIQYGAHILIIHVIQIEEAHILLASVGFAQARPNYIHVHVCTQSNYQPHGKRMQTGPDEHQSA